MHEQSCSQTNACVDTCLCPEYLDWSSSCLCSSATFQSLFSWAVPESLKTSVPWCCSNPSGVNCRRAISHQLLWATLQTCRPLLKIASQCGVSPSFVFLPQMHPTRGRSDLCSEANDGHLVRQSFPGSCYAASIAPGSCSSSNSRGLPFELAGTEKLARSFVSFSLGCFWMALKAYVLPVPSAADGAIGAQTFGRPCGLWTPRMHGIADRRSSMAPTCDLYDYVSSAWWHLSNMELKTKQSRPACLGCPKVPAQQPLRDSSRPVRPYGTNVAFLNSCQCSLSLWSQWHKIETICASQYFSKKTS